MKGQLHTPAAYFWDSILILGVWKAVWAVGMDSVQVTLPADGLCST